MTGAHPAFAVLREYDKTRGADEPELLLLSSGNAEQHRALGFKSQIILDDENDVSKKIGMDGTPSAVLIDENGKILKTMYNIKADKSAEESLAALN